MPKVATKIIVTVSSNLLHCCPLCSTSLDGAHGFDAACNHLLAHGLKCLHVGQQTTDDNDGKPRHSTVAVFGK